MQGIYHYPSVSLTTASRGGLISAMYMSRWECLGNSYQWHPNSRESLGLDPEPEPACIGWDPGSSSVGNCYRRQILGCSKFANVARWGFWNQWWGPKRLQREWRGVALCYFRRNGWFIGSKVVNWLYDWTYDLYVCVDSWKKKNGVDVLIHTIPLYYFKKSYILLLWLQYAR